MDQIIDNKLIVSNIISLLRSYRIDIKNYGNKDSNIEILNDKDLIVSSPAWLSDDKGNGKIIQGNSSPITIVIKAINSGILSIKFRSKDAFFKGQRFPLWITYSSILIDGVEILEKNLSVSHDNFYNYNYRVRDNQLIKIKIQLAHQYTYEAINEVSKQYLDDLVPSHADSLILDISNTVFNQIVENNLPTCERSEFFNCIEADAYIPINLDEDILSSSKLDNSLFHPNPFEGVLDISLTSILKTLKFGINNWLKQYKIQNRDGKRVLIDQLYNLSMIIDTPEQDIEDFVLHIRNKLTHLFNLLLSVLHNSKHICFICNSNNENIRDYMRFLKEISELYHNPNLTLIKIESAQKNVVRYKVNDKIQLFVTPKDSTKSLINNKCIYTNLFLSPKAKTDILRDKYKEIIANYEDANASEKQNISNNIFSYKQIKILSAAETIEKIKNEHLSISRYGDGELRWMLFPGFSGGFQSYDPKLSHRLQQVFSSNHPNLLLCLDHHFSNGTQLSEYYKGVVSTTKFDLGLFCNFNSVFGFAGITRNANNVPKLKELWKDRDVVIVEGEYSRLGVGNDLFDNVATLSRILCPAKNAFTRYDEILFECRKQPKNVLFIIALGPTASVLAYDLTINGYMALDVGHIDIVYEWHLRGANGKILVPGKYVNEVQGGNIVEDCKDPDYIKSIIFKLI